MKFTNNQSNAIHTFNKNLSVSAGAGSGKTTVLVSKYCELIQLKKAHISEILAITFTNKAAKDMKRRVRELIESKVNELTNIVEKSYWINVKNQFDSAQITTIHSFGLNALQKYPLEANIHPDSSLLDEIQALLALQDVTKAILISESKNSDSLKRLIQQLGSSYNVVNSLVKVYLKARSLGGDPTNISQKATDYEATAKSLLVETKQSLINKLHELKMLAMQSKSKSKFIKRWQEINVGSYINAINNVKTLDDYSFMSQIKQLKNDCSRPAKELADIVKAISYKSKSTGLVYEYEALLAYFDALPIWHKVNELILKIHVEYSEMQKQRRALDYGDLEWGLLKLLASHERVREEYQQKFKYIMVDEFQDTSPLQQQLIRYLAPFEHNKLFIVGDARQSIYRFRAAEVEGFIEMEQNIKSSDGLRIVLEENFRSEPQLIEFFNQFFEELFKDTPIVYDRVIAGKNKTHSKPFVELWLPSNETSQEGIDAKGRHEIEAKIIANNVIKMNRQGTDFGDIAILFRALTDVKTYERQLQKQNIPYVVVGSRGFFNRQEIIDLINVITYFVYSKDKVALVGILRSPLFGLSDEALYYLSKSEYLLELKPCIDLNESDSMKWLNAISIIKSWRLQVALKPISSVIQHVVDSTNYNAVLLASPGYGLQAVANVEKLINTIIKLEQDGITSKVDILRYIEALRDSNAQYGDAVLSETKNAVQIMTVHQSKGLEFNTVIVAQCERESRNTNTSLLQYTKDFGLVVRKRGFEDNLVKNVYYNNMSEYEKQKELEESYRLLYVAATRAEKQLIFSAAPDKWPKEEHRSWLKLLADYLNLASQIEENTIISDLVAISLHDVGDTHKNNSIKETELDKDLSISLMEEVTKTYETKPILTASALIDYSVCPKLFYYKNVHKLPAVEELKLETELDSVLLGDIVHRVCEKANIKHELYSVLNKVLADTIIPYGLEQKYLVESKKILSKYEISTLLASISSAREVKSEIPFTLKHHHYILSGVIDKIVIKDNKIKIIDYKSGNKTQQAVDKYRIQIALYALALAKQLKQYPSSLVVYFMTSGKEHEYIHELKDYDACSQLLTEVITKIDCNLKNNSFYRQESTCLQCKYSLLCKNYN